MVCVCTRACVLDHKPQTTSWMMMMMMMMINMCPILDGYGVMGVLLIPVHALV